jgi:hypothetical protein
VHTEDAERFTTVGQTSLTRTAGATLKIWADGDNITDGDVGDRITTGDDLDGKLMPQNAWIAEEWLFASKCV